LSIYAAPSSLNELLRNYLKTVTLSEAKGLFDQNHRFPAALRRYFLFLDNSLGIASKLINNCLAKNKVFFAPAFGFVLFYFYIFDRTRTGWGINRVLQIFVLALDVFHRGENSLLPDFSGQDGSRRPFFSSCPQRCLLLQYPTELLKTC